MANTENGIFYNDDYNSIADVLLDEKKMAESVDEQLKVKKEEIEEVSKKNIEQDNSISELQEEIENLRNISNIMPSVNSQGENITLNNTAKNVRFRKFKVGGNSEQETREGYNLLNANLPYTTSSSGNTIKWLGKENIPKMEVNKYYYLHGKFSDGTIFSGAHAAFVIADSRGQILNKTFGSSFQNTVDISNAINCYIYTDSTYVNKTVTEVAIYEGKENKAYEQYGVMPSPDYPSKVETVGNNINLFNFKDKKDVSPIYTVDDEGWITCQYDNTSGTSAAYLNYYTNNLNLKTGTLYNIIVEIKKMSGTGRFVAVSAANDSQFDTTFNILLGTNFADVYNSVLKTRTSFQNSINGLRTFATFSPGQAGSITFRISVLEDTSVNANNFVYSNYNQGSTKIIIEKSDKTQKQEYIMPVQKEFLTDDYFDLDNEEEVHGWNKLVLTGEEDWSTKQTSDNSVRFQAVLLQSCLKDNEGCSNYFKVQSEIDSKQSCGISVYAGNTTMYVWIPKTVAETVETFKTWLKSLYDAGTPVVVYYKTATETRLKFTDEQKAVAKEIQKATSYEDTTHIYSTDEVSPIFDVEAVADIRKLIANISTTAEGER